MKNNKINYLIIIIYGLLLTFLFLGENNLFGSNTDWISQHIIIPDYLRNIFYETKNILPNLAINMGAGQNIFNFSYYGLLSPVILVSYFLPFLKTTTYIIIASIILYVLSGVLIYKFLNTKCGNKTALFLSLVFLTLAPMFHFHHHIMFVWNIPFIILSLIGVDKYIEKNKSFLLMLSTFLMIMVNYYYSIPGLMVIVIYGIYRLLNQDKFNLKEFFINLLKASLRIIIPILMAGILLVPTANIILETGRTLKSNFSYLDLFIPNFEEVVYKTFSMGLSGLLLLCPFGLLLEKKKNKGDIFLSLVLIILTFIPLFMYILNGLLYIRGKVLIPFCILYIFSVSRLITNIKENNLDLKKLCVISLFLMVIILVTGEELKMLFLCGDILISLLSIYLFKKYHKELFIYVPLLLILISRAYYNNLGETYVSVEKYQDINNKSVLNLIDSIPDGEYYRTYSFNYPLETSNKYYNPNYYGVSIYSSNYNKYYWEFYNNLIGNNINSRNAFTLTGTNNELFYNFMGVKYIVSNKSPGLKYTEIKKDGKFALYYNKDAYPMVYATSEYGNNDDYSKLDYPYNIDYLLNNPVTSSKSTKDYESHVKRIDIGEEDSYEFKVNDYTKYIYELPEIIDNKYLLIRFKNTYNQTCEEGDVYITINGSRNKLTCSDWMYHNQNYNFEYVVSANNLESLDIRIKKGTYKISNVEVYEMDYLDNTYETLDNLKINKKNSTITGETNLDENGYVITSIPYDKGFRVYVDDKEQDTEIVNLAFLGFKVPKGSHEIKIVYHSPGLILGLLTSFLGICSMIAILIYEKFKKQIDKLIMKNKEILMYLIFGVLTTIVNFGVYFALTLTILDAQDKIELQIANVISWIVAVTFAYFTNRKYVFASKNKNVMQEALKFCESRVVTLILDMAFMFIFVSLLHFNDGLIKVIDQFLVIATNYILSKLVVFKKEGSKK